MSTLSVIIETVPGVSGNPMFLPAEMCFTALFTAEFALRLYACHSIAERLGRAGWRRLKDVAELVGE